MWYIGPFFAEIVHQIDQQYYINLNKFPPTYVTVPVHCSDTFPRNK